MQAIVLTKTGNASEAFELKEWEKPSPKAGEILVKVQASGLNFADVMARKGMYQDAPKIPCVLGYDVVGEVAALGEGVTDFVVGDRVTAMTRFGGYAEFAIVDTRGAVKIPSSMPLGEATALTTQYCTAYFAAAEMVQLHKGDKVLIQSAAGGVGTALVQYAKYKGCEIFGTAGSAAKLQYLKECGVHHPINYNETDFAEVIKKETGGKGVDVIFDAVGGNSVKRGIKSLASGGRIVCYGAADMTDKNVFGKLKAGLGFGIYHPAEFMMTSTAIIGVNMLRIADNKPEVLKRCLENVVVLTEQGIFKPLAGKVFPVNEFAAAHEFLEGRKSMGKVSLIW